ncbi:YihY/virulence factor BrkB family protein [Arthrobacter sp. JCM 19049]|uniref:YihY/virulence factor BrkB family protein n=1 Tax=Arthrobacter sp. JCM 19049 TaxID=1460643 RepID=UPI0035B52A0C
MQESHRAGRSAQTAHKAEHAPAPDDNRKPDLPTDLKSRSWKYVFKRSIGEFTRKKCTDQAAALTYFTMLSLFPALLAMVSLLGLVGQAEKTTQNMLQLLGEVASDQVVQTLEQPIQQLTNAPSAGFAFAAGLLGALWSASGYVGAFGRAINHIYDVQEGRPFYKLKPILLLITLVLLVAAAVMAVLLVVSGHWCRALDRPWGWVKPASWSGTSPSGRSS